MTPLQPLALWRLWRLPSGNVPVHQTGLFRLPAAAVPGPVEAASFAEGTGLGQRCPWIAGGRGRSRPYGRRMRPGAGAAAVCERTLAAGLEATDGGGTGRGGRGSRRGCDRPWRGQPFPGPGVCGRRTVTGGKAEPDGPALASLEPLGLVYVPFRQAAVLTTLRQAAEWRRLNRVSRRRRDRSPPP